LFNHVTSLFLHMQTIHTTRTSQTSDFPFHLFHSTPTISFTFDGYLILYTIPKTMSAASVFFLSSLPGFDLHNPFTSTSCVVYGLQSIGRPASRRARWLGEGAERLVSGQSRVETKITGWLLGLNINYTNYI